METQTFTRPTINIASVIKEINLSKVKDLGLGAGKIFPYIELYHTNRYFKAIETSTSPLSLSKMLLNLHNKSKKRDPSHYHPLTMKYKNSKYANQNFIENARRELSHLHITKSINKQSNLRSQSENNKKNYSPKYLTPQNKLKDLIIMPAPIFPQRVKNCNARNDSLPDCSIDLQKLDLPYAYKYLNSYNSKILDLSDCKDASNNT